MRVAIVGGGYSGVAAAVQLLRASETVAVSIFEPREDLGRGVAYSTPDPEHRLNGPVDNHLIDPNRPFELAQWCERHAILRRDPEALAANGAVYIRRHDFGTYAGDVIGGFGTRIRHHRSLAIGLRMTAGQVEVRAADAQILPADVVVIATGNTTSALPKVFDPVRDHPSVLQDPFDLARLRSLGRGARVLLVGGGLTALDVMATLLGSGHRGKITAISRHGVRPRPPRSNMKDASVQALLERIEGNVPPFVESSLAGGVRALVVALRERIAEVRKAGGDWQVPFDDVRNSVWRFWPRLPLEEKRRFLRHLRVWYDAHRFRAPPQNDAIVQAAERNRRAVFCTGRIVEARADGETLAARWTGIDGAKVEQRFEAIVNCTGLDPDFGAASNPFLADLLSQGLIRGDPTGIGFEVDSQYRPIGRDGTASPRLRMIGPPTAGSCGDSLGVIFIAPQIRRMVRALMV